MVSKPVEQIQNVVCLFICVALLHCVNRLRAQLVGLCETTAGCGDLFLSIELENNGGKHSNPTAYNQPE